MTSERRCSEPTRAWGRIQRCSRRRSPLSWAEQGGDRSTDLATARRLHDLNQRYEARFGFPFVEWVAGRPLSAIAEVMEHRLGNDRSTELEKGSAALVSIARDRLRPLEGENAIS